MQAERKPIEASFTPQNAKKRPFSQSVTNRHRMRLMARTFARMRQSIPVPWGHPQNIPGFKNSQTRMVAWFPENIPNIPKIPTHFGMTGILLVQTYI